MKLSAYILAVGLVAATACSDSEPEVPPAAPAPAAPSVDAVAPGTTPAVAAPAGGSATPAAPGDVEPELKPIQMAIQSFETQNKRMPMNVEELVSSGALQSLPPPPPGKMYYIDHGTKRIKLGGRE